MLDRLTIKKILKNVDSVSRQTLFKKANQLGLDVKKDTTDTKLRKQIKKGGERQINSYMDTLIKQFNQERKIQKENLKYKTNNQGVKIPKQDFKHILKLQNEYNNKKDRILKRYIKQNNLSQNEIDFLKGKQVKHVNSSESMELNVNFRHENLVDSISEGVDLKFYIKTMEEEIKKFNIGSVIQNRSRKLNSFLKTWVDTLELTQDRANEIKDLYKNMNVIEKAQFNKDLEHKMQMVDSVTRNPKSGYDTYHALKEIVFVQEDRTFISI